jgi:aminopeptidase-like protein
MNSRGPAVTTWLAKQLSSDINRRLSYRIIFIPETIGAIAYISAHLEDMQRKVIAGYVVTCVGDNNTFSYLSSRKERTIADRAATHVLKHLHPNFISYSYLDRGSDERQYCSPGVDLPVASVMRSKYGTYPEYHTSLDDLDYISSDGLAGAFDVLSRCLQILEANLTYRACNPCEPQLGKHDMYAPISTKKRSPATRTILNLLAYCDGNMDLLDIAEKINVPAWELAEYAQQLVTKKLIAPID